MNDRLRRSAAHVFVDDLDSPVLSTEDAHHLGRVLRLREGQSVTVSDGRGNWRPCEWSDGSLVPVGDTVSEPRRTAPLTVALSPVKGDRTEDAVEKLVEIGIDRILLLAPVDNSVVRWDAAKGAAAVERMQRIARSASAQSRRVHLPVVTGPVTLAEVLSIEGAAMAEPGGGADFAGITTVVVGPEGGFSPAEVALARRTVSLGSGILRAGTAAVVAGTLMVAHPGR